MMTTVVMTQSSCTIERQLKSCPSSRFKSSDSYTDNINKWVGVAGDLVVVVVVEVVEVCQVSGGCQYQWGQCILVKASRAVASLQAEDGLRSPHKQNYFSYQKSKNLLDDGTRPEQILIIDISPRLWRLLAWLYWSGSICSVEASVLSGDSGSLASWRWQRGVGTVFGPLLDLLQTSTILQPRIGLLFLPFNLMFWDFREKISLQTLLKYWS